MGEESAVVSHGQALNFGQPVAIGLFAILHFLPDADDPAGTVACLRDAVAGVRGVLRGQLHVGAIQTLEVIDLPALLAGLRRGRRRPAGHRLHRRPHRPRPADPRRDRP
jgi:hypothetical protein